MTDPSRSFPDRNELDPTLARPDGNFVLPPNRAGREMNFGPPEQDGDLGKIGRYRVLKKLGEGGMGAVYLAADTMLVRRVALKVMLPQYAANAEARERFLREARAAAMVKSDHVVTIHDVGEDRGPPFIAMEYLLGYPLDQFLRVQGNPSLAHVFRIGRETALGLAAAHKLGLIHRDVKPGNIWLEAPKGRVKLLDFGLARAANDDTHLTTSGAVVGTPAFMSPEQGRGLKLDPRSDLFSLGVMLYRLATGRMPFTGNTTMAVLTSLAIDTPAPPRQVKPTVPPALEAVIEKLLAKNPADRYQTAREVVDALLEAEQQKSVPGQPPAEVVPMAITAQFEIVGDESGDSGSSPQVLTATVATEPERKKPARKKAARKKSDRGRLRWPVASGAGVFAVLALLAAFLFWPSKGTLIVESDDPDAEVVVKKDGAIVRERTKDREIKLKAGTYTVELASAKPGQKLAPEQFEVTKKGQTRVRVSAEQKPSPLPAPAEDPDRVAAEWVVSVGGRADFVSAGTVGSATKKDGLPKTPLKLTGAYLHGLKGVNDTTLGNLRDCKALTGIDLSACDAVGDAGLLHFKGNPNLLSVELGSCPKVSDLGLANLKDCKRITFLGLSNCPLVGNAGLANFKDCTELLHLNLSFCPLVSDEEDAHLSKSSKLVSLNLKDCRKVTGAGVAPFASCKGLRYVDFSRTDVSDAGLEPFKNCKNLTDLSLQSTWVSAAKVAEFRKDFPECRIAYDPDRVAAEYALSARGMVWIEVGGVVKTDIKKVADLPNEPFAVVMFNLSRKTDVTDAGLIAVRGCRFIRHLYLNESVVTDAGLAHFAGLASLIRMDIYRTAMTDTGLANFKDCKNLTVLGLDFTKVTDAGLIPLRECKNLTVLNVPGTKVTKDGVEAFAKAVPGCRIAWDGGVIEPVKK